MSLTIRYYFFPEDVCGVDVAFDQVLTFEQVYKILEEDGGIDISQVSDIVLTQDQGVVTKLQENSIVVQPYITLRLIRKA